jgi:Tol biopolymer transport system component/DNA-binding winged helix-turn-helix (wHTH) protein
MDRKMRLPVEAGGKNDKLAFTDVKVVRSTVRFGAFEVDLDAAELRKAGIRLRLQEQPYQVLAALLEEPGQVVSREELIRRLWPDGTVVDFDRGLNAAVTRLRQVLRDSAETPRYVETVARRGYRFIAPVEAPDIEPVRTIPAATPPRRQSLVWIAAAATLMLAAGVGAVILSRRESLSSGQPLRVLPLTTEPGFEWCPTLSPDGNQVAFQWNKGGGASHIYVKQVGSGDPVRLTSGSQAEFAPAWSRDGRYIAFLRELDASRTGIFYVPPLGGVERQVTECPSPYIWSGYMLRRLDWTPDGRNLIVSCPDTAGGNNALKVVSLNTGAMSPLTTPSATPGFGDEEPAVSPDGRAVAFVRGTLRVSGMVHLLSLSADLKAAGEPRVLASTQGAWSLAWMVGGKEILYDRGGVLWRIGVAGGRPRRVLEVGTSVRQPALAREGRLAYAMPVWDANIWRQELTSEGAAAQPAAPLIVSTATEMSPDYSRDGTRIAFQSDRLGTGTIWACASDGTRCVQVTEMQSGSPRWSPDGQHLAFDSVAAGNWDVLVMPANGGQPQRLTTDPANDSQPSWSRDGKSIYFASARTGRYEVWKAPASGGAAVQVTRNGGYTAFESVDGKALYYTKGDNDSKLWRCNLDGSGETVVLDAVSYRGFVVTADRIYYTRPEPGEARTLRVRHLDTGKDTQISMLPNTGRLGLSLSPDNRYLIYSQLDREGSDLMLVPDFR